MPSLPSLPSFVTVRAPRDSVWQSIVERVAKRQESAPVASKGFAAPADESVDDKRRHLLAFVSAAHEQVFLADELRSGRDAISRATSLEPPTRKDAAAVGAPPAQGGQNSFMLCASLAAKLAQAKVFGTKETVKTLQGEFDFNVCDPFWIQCVEEYETFFKLEHGQIPYRAGLDNVLREEIPANATIAIFGDWGTGMPEAVALLEQIRDFKPDILMHLGDVYYSGTQNEMEERFLDVCTKVFGVAMPRRFSLSGNHDMYSGGAGYYWLVDRLGQGASYFAVQNGDWLFIAMDTGLHDTDPKQLGSAATFVDPREAVWVNDLIKASQNQKIVLFSHHPLFTAFDPISGAAVNTLLLEQIRPSLPKLTAWFWGHEHRLAVYDPFLGLARGRCIGHSAIPVFADASGDPPRLAGVPVHREGGQLLDMGTNGRIFKHGFAIMTLAGKDADVAYYRQGDTDPLWRESF
jgi:hypothetical protein